MELFILWLIAMGVVFTPAIILAKACIETERLSRREMKLALAQNGAIYEETAELQSRMQELNITPQIEAQDANFIQK